MEKKQILREEELESMFEDFKSFIIPAATERIKSFIRQKKKEWETLARTEGIEEGKQRNHLLDGDVIKTKDGKEFVAVLKENYLELCRRPNPNNKKRKR